MNGHARAITLFRGGFDTEKIARILGVPESYALKMVTVGRDKPCPYEGVWPVLLGYPHDQIIKARQTGIWDSPKRK